jgi:hypothetical protein
MNPEDDDLLFDGTELKPGMVVLLESSTMKGSPEDLESTYSRKRYLENNRWCEVVRVEITSRYDMDENNRPVPGSPLVSLLARYPDSTLAKRTFDASFAWYVKKFSIPTE